MVVVFSYLRLKREIGLSGCCAMFVSAKFIIYFIVRVIYLWIVSGGKTLETHI